MKSNKSVKAMMKSTGADLISSVIYINTPEFDKHWMSKLKAFARSKSTKEIGNA